MRIFVQQAMAAVLLSGTALALDEDKSEVVVGMEEFIGGTGDSAAQLVREDLKWSGYLRISDSPGNGGGGWLLRGSSSAGRIDGALVDAKGTVVFNNHYDEPDLRDNAHAFADDVVTAITEARGIAGDSKLPGNSQMVEPLDHGGVAVREPLK